MADRFADARRALDAITDDELERLMIPLDSAQSVLASWDGDYLMLFGSDRDTVALSPAHQIVLLSLLRDKWLAEQPER